jgi:hypothetical protein
MLKLHGGPVPLLILNPSTINTNLVQLGLLVGLLQTTLEGELVLDTGWFADPTGSDGFASIPTRGAALVDILQSLLGSSTGKALGAPTTAVDWTWSPIPRNLDDLGAPSAATQASGVYVVSAASQRAQVLGVGALKTFTEGAFQFTPYAIVPIVALDPGKTPNGAVDFVFANSATPAQLGLQITGSFGNGEVTFNGIQIAVDLNFATGSSSQPFSLQIILQGLTLPGQPAADTSLTSIGSNLDEWIKLGISILAGQLASALGPSGTEISDTVTGVLALLGLDGSTPSPDWSALVSGDAEGALLAWLQAIAGTPAVLSAWLNQLGALMPAAGGAGTAQYVSGSGTVADPFSIQVVTLSDSTSLSLTFATRTDAGAFSLLPGLEVRSRIFRPRAGLPVGVQLALSAVLVELTLAGGASEPSGPLLLPSVDFAIGVQNVTAGQPLFEIPDVPAASSSLPTTSDGSPTFSVGSIQVALSQAYRSGSRSWPSPTLRLIDVQAAAGSWPTIDLTNYDDLIDDGGQVLSDLVQQAITRYFGAAAGNVAASLEGLLGFASPSHYPGKWPVPTLLDPSRIGLSLANPVAALGAYYASCLATRDSSPSSGDQPVWLYLLPLMAGALGADQESPPGGLPSGSGTEADPWQVTLAAASGGSQACLQAWLPPAAAGSPPTSTQTLRLCLDLSVPVFTFDRMSARAAVSLDMLDLALPNPDGSGSFGASWLPDVAAQLRLTGMSGQNLETPSFGGLVVGAREAMVGVGWERTGGFYGTAMLAGVEITSPGTSPPLSSSLGDLVFNTSTTGWQHGVSELTQIILATLGMWLVEHGGPAGVTLTAALGLLPSLPQILAQPSAFAPPAGLALPDSWPTLNPSNPQQFFENPWSDLVSQLGGFFAYGAGGTLITPLLELLDWAVDGSYSPPEMASPPGGGAIATADQPWSVLLSDAWGVEVLVWPEYGVAPANGALPDRIGLGLRRVMATEVLAGVEARVVVRIDVAYLPVAGVAAGTVVLPRARITCDFSNPSGAPLVAPSSEGQVGTFSAGACATLTAFDPTTGAVSIDVAPIVTFDESGLSAADLGTIDFSSTGTTQGLQALETLLDAVAGQLLESSDGSTTLAAVLRLFSDLGLFNLVPSGPGDQDAGFNAGAWTALLANPSGYFVSRAKTILASPGGFFSDLATVLGFPGFGVSTATANLLAALGLAAPTAAGGFAPSIGGWLALVEHPVSFLSRAASAIFTDATTRAALTTALGVTSYSLTAPPFLIGKPGAPVATLEGSATIDLQNLALTTSSSLAATAVGAALTFDFELAAVDGGGFTTSFGFSLAAVDAGGVMTTGSPPASTPLPAPFPPLPLYAWSQAPGQSPVVQLGPSLDQLQATVPQFLLSVFAARVINPYLLANPKGPLADVLRGLALVPPSGSPQVSSLLGLLLHPIEWMSSDAVFGDASGGLDYARIGTFLSRLAQTGPSVDGITISSAGGAGLELAGLPYGATVTLVSRSGTGIGLDVAINPSLPTPDVTIDIAGGLSFVIGGGVQTTGDTIEIGYAFEGRPPVALQASYGAGGFTLQVEIGSPSGQVIQLVPFGGLTQLVEGSVGLLEAMADKMVAYWREHRALPPTELDKLISGLVDFAAVLPAGLTSPTPTITSVESLVSLVGLVAKGGALTGLDWLLHALDQPAVLDRLATVLNHTLGLDVDDILVKIGSGDCLIVYKPSTLPADVGLQISVGTRTTPVDGQPVTQFGIWIDPLVRLGPHGFQWLVLSAVIGLGIETPVASPPRVLITLSPQAGVDVPGLPKGGPQILCDVEYDSGKNALTYPLYVFPEVSGEALDPNSGLVLQLLPAPKFLIDGQRTSTLSWFEGVAVQLFIPLLADVILANAAVTRLLDQPLGASKTTVGEILCNFGLIETSSGPSSPGAYVLADLKASFPDPRPVTILEKLLYAVLSVGARSPGLPLFELPAPAEGGVFLVADGDASTANATNYGLRVQVAELALTAASANPAVTLQLGAAQASESSPPAGVAPGISIYFVREVLTPGGPAPTPAAYFALHLIDVGVDLAGGQRRPLIDSGGYQLGGIGLRASLDADRTGVIGYGGSLELANIGLPLGPQLAGSTSRGNPVAQSLVASPSGSAGGAGAVNPTFSVTASYAHGLPSGDGFDLLLQSAAGQNIITLPIQRSFGPLFCTEIDIGWQPSSDVLSIGFGGSVSLAGLSIDVVDLSVGIPITTPTDFSSYQLALKGLDVSFRGGAVQLSGGLVETTSSSGSTEYDGNINVQASSFTLSALGSYAVIDGAPSLFAFALLSAPLGGPAFFYVTGLAGGFGYNRALRLPTQDQVAQFPLVAAAFPDQSTFDGNSPNDALSVMSGGGWVTPSIGEYWLAAGVRFTSFELLQSFAVAVVELGNDFEISLLGLSTLKLPQDAGSTTYFYAELALDVALIPDEGVLQASLVLTPNSYILDPACKLTGGFAFYLWFAENQIDPAESHTGDFVVTLGGYSPEFQPPKWYPSEPRLGFSWTVSDDISITGGAYFALTPSCVMLGGSLDAAYQSGGLRAWFTAETDVLVAWRPFHYDASISVDVGASYSFHLIVPVTLSVSLGASLKLWGPPTGGIVEVDWYVISFSFTFGDQSTSSVPPVITWSEFAQYLLPAPTAPTSPAAAAGGGAPLEAAGGGAPLEEDARFLAAPDDPSPTQPFTSARIVSGLLQSGSDGTWYVCATRFSFAATTSVPITEVVFVGPSGDTTWTGVALGIVPMNQQNIASPLTVRLVDPSGNMVNLRPWSLTPSTGYAPSALWDPKPHDNSSPNRGPVKGALLGIASASPPATPDLSGPPVCELSAFATEDLTPSESFDLPSTAALTIPSAGSLRDVEAAMNPPVQRYRTAMLDVAASYGMNVDDGRLDILASDAESVLQATPLENPLGGLPAPGASPPVGASNVLSVRRRVRPAPRRSERQARVEVATRAPRLHALIRQHASPVAGGARSTHATRGRVHRSGLHASSRDLAALRAIDRADGGHDLHPGATALFEVSSGHVAVDGRLPVRVVSVDQFGALVEDRVIEAGRPASITLPDRAARVAVTALAPGSTEGPVAGWHRGASMILMTPNALLGEHALARPDAPIHMVEGRSRHDCGVVDGAALAMANRIERNGAAEPGAVETFLPASVRTVAVMARRDPTVPVEAADAEPFQLAIVQPLRADPGRSRYAKVPVQRRFQDGNVECGLYAVPAGSGAGPFVRTTARAGHGWLLDGVFGVAEADLDATAARWSDVELRPRAVCTADTFDLLTRVEVSAPREEQR